ncbi:MAG: TRAP transporter substrate-binding protein [Eubacteriales bacterium]
MKINRIFKLTIIAVTVIGMFFSTSFAQQNEDSIITIRSTHNDGPDSNWNRAVVKFAELAEKYTDGKVKVEVYPSGVLSNNDNVVIAQQVTSGVLEMCTVAGAFWERFNIPELGFYQLPFLFEDIDQAFMLYRSPVVREQFKKFESIGVKMIDIWPRGFAVITNNKKPIKTMEDFKGLRMRGAEAGIAGDIWRGLGASAVPISFGELYTALQLGTADGQQNPFGTIYGANLHEVQKYMTVAPLYTSTMTVCFNKAFWDSLSDEIQAALQQASYEAGLYKKHIDNLDYDLYVPRMIEEAGVEIYEVPDEEIERWREATKSVYDKYREDLGGEFINKILQVLENLSEYK